MGTFSDLNLGERMKRFGQLVTDPFRPTPRQEEEEKIQEEERREEVLREEEARCLRSAWAGAREIVLPALKAELAEVETKKTQYLNHRVRFAYWSGHQDRLLGIIRRIEDA